MHTVASRVADIEAKIANNKKPEPAKAQRPNLEWPDRRPGVFSYIASAEYQAGRIADEYNTYCQQEVVSGDSPNRIDAGLRASSTAFRRCGL